MTVENNTRWPSPSVTSVPEYQISGLPYCETKTVNTEKSSFTFPRVTRWITVSSTVAVDIYFTAAGNGDPLDNQYYKVPANTHTLRLELRCAKLYVRTLADGDVSVAAGLTHIDKSKTVPEAMLDWI
tara:strand:+ start:1025 stop:1405 length:381 start_codon:yes stop_codon:yes gene_type:complete